jgi:predicted nucleic acid-binding protein
METDAINMILSKVKQGKYRLLVSPIHIKEIEAYDDILERVELQTILKKMGEQMIVDLSRTRARAEELVNFGFGIADAAHVAFAEGAGALFISCDNKLIKKCMKHNIKVWCGNPVAFCEMEKLR